MTFKELLQSEMRKREMSARAFAEFIGVGHTTINRLLDEQNPAKPTLDIILKFAENTHISVLALVQIAYPETASETALSPNAQVMAQQIEQLPNDLKIAVEAIIHSSKR